MSNNDKNPNRPAIRRARRISLVILYFALLYLVSIKLFLIFLGLFVILFILSSVGITVIDDNRSRGAKTEATGDLPVPVDTLHQSFGPGTNTGTINKGNPFHAGLQFLLLSTLPFFALVGLAIINASFEVIPEPVATVIACASTILLLMCLLSGGYLLLLGLLGRSERTGRDENKSVGISSRKIVRRR